MGGVLLMSDINIELDQLANLFEKASEEIESKMSEGVTEVAEDLLSISVKLAPLDEGGLMENGSVDPAKKEGSDIVARVGYSKEYALRRHEEMYNLGKTSAQKPSIDGMSVGRKFLEQPSVKYGEKYAEYLGNKSKEVF